MSKLITRERVNQLVRELPKKIGMLEYRKLKNRELYYVTEKNGGFKWVDTKKEDLRGQDVYSLNIPIQVAYERKFNALRRKNLGELDELFYQAINSSKVAKELAYIHRLENKDLPKINRQVKRSKLSLGVAKEKGYGYGSLFVFMNADKGKTIEDIKTKNESFNKLDWEGRGKYVENFLRKGEYGGSQVDGDIEGDTVFLSLGVESIDKWEGFIKGVIELDKELNG